MLDQFPNILDRQVGHLIAVNPTKFILKYFRVMHLAHICDKF